MQVKKLAVLLDKKSPPEHSFIDGYLTQVEGFEIMLLTEFSRLKFMSYEHLGLKGMDVLLPRKSVYRLISFFYTPILILFLFIKGYRSFFIRNDPVLLCSTVLLKLFFPSKIRLIYQNSFPHENFNATSLTSKFAKILIQKSLRFVDRVFVVSEKAKQRILDYCPKCQVVVVPLCIGNDVLSINLHSDFKRVNSQSINFIYIGSHDENRELDFVLNELLKHNNHRVTCYGGSEEKIDLIQQKLDRKVLKRVIFKGVLSRKAVLNVIGTYDCGICIIPPKDIFMEASPTKLTEYLALDLPVLINSEIPSHLDFSEVNGVYMSSYSNIPELCNVFESALNSETIVTESRRDYVLKKYNYNNFLGYFDDFKR